MSVPEMRQSQFVSFVTNLLETMANMHGSEAWTLEQKLLYNDRQTNLSQLLTRLMNSGTEQCVVEAAMVLLFRVLSTVGFDAFDRHNCHKLWQTALILANAAFEDDTIPMLRWQKMGLFAWSVEEMRFFVMEFLSRLEYYVIVQPEELATMRALVFYPFYQCEFSAGAVESFLSYERALRAQHGGPHQ